MAKSKLYRPVLFGDSGGAQVAYNVDAIHDALGVVVEIEAGRGARGNALYRDLIRASLIVNAKYLVIGLMQTYRHKNLKKGTVNAVAGHMESKRAIDAVYAKWAAEAAIRGLLLFGD